MNRKEDEEEEDEWRRKRDPFRDIFRKSKDPFSDIFSFTDIDKEFERMQKLADELVRKGLSDVNRKDPFVYGFSIRTGPNGEPRIQEFGNAKDYLTREDEKSEWTPLSDIQETEDDLLVTIDLPGVEKENINIEVKDTKLLLDVEGKRNYRTTIDLPKQVDPTGSEATYNNGVLEVKLKKLEEEKGQSIQIK
ncbi:MAG: archaeal heat shock protein Hsp20 [Thermoplasmatota archaeon]